jgi:N-sulfoglucosamine sulfohydrolase
MTTGRTLFGSKWAVSWIASVMLSIPALPGQAATASRAEARPNILLLTADDLGLQLGSYGDRQARTPNLDALAARGLRFDHAYVTQASCSPSRASIFTGLYPHQHGMLGLAHLGYRLNPKVPLLPDLLRSVGYSTWLIGKDHVAGPVVLGFEHNLLEHSETRQRSAVAEAIRGSDLGRGPGPFFLSVNLADPHVPWTPQVEGLPEPTYDPEQVRGLDFLGLDGPAARRITASYLNCVTRFDAIAGEVIAETRHKSGQRPLLILFVSDHGPPITRGKTTVYEAGVRVPMIAAWDGVIPPATSTEALVSTVDLLPTLADVAGFEPPPGLPGGSLQPLFEDPRGAAVQANEAADGESSAPRRYLFTQFSAHAPPHAYPRRAVRGETYKLIVNLWHDRPNPLPGLSDGLRQKGLTSDEPDVQAAYDRLGQPPRLELYDLNVDPHEFHNLADDPDHASDLARLAAALDAWQVRTGDVNIPEKPVPDSTP